jgi:hypothetical protein
MPLTKEPTQIFEPNPLACGQSVLAMLFDLDVNCVIESLENSKETNLREMISFVESNGVKISKEKKPVFQKEELPQMCILSLETPHCWHWSLYFKGRFYDPEYGILDDFPPSSRRYYFEIFEN